MPGALRRPKEWLLLIRSVGVLEETRRNDQQIGARMARGVTHIALACGRCVLLRERTVVGLGDVTQHGAHCLQRVQDPRLG